MTHEELERIKNEGAEKSLCDRARTELWTAERACQEASRDNFKDFVKKVAQARRALGDAEDLLWAVEQIP